MQNQFPDKCVSSKQLEEINRKNPNSKKSIPNYKRKKVFERDGGKCVICGKKLILSGNANSDDVMNIDHIIPVSKGGKDNLQNLRCLCRKCNSGRGNTFGEKLYNSLADKFNNIKIDFRRIKDDIQCGFSNIEDVKELENKLDLKYTELKKEFQEFYNI